MKHHELTYRMKEKAELVQAVVTTVCSMEDVLRYVVDLTLRLTLKIPGPMYW